MLGSVILESAIGTLFVILLVSVACTAINELIARLTDLRARHLRDGIGRMLADDKELSKLFYKHPLIKEISQTSAFVWFRLDSVPIVKNIVAVIRNSMSKLGESGFNASFNAGKAILSVKGGFWAGLKQILTGLVKSEPWAKLPAHIPSEVFSAVILDLDHHLKTRIETKTQFTSQALKGRLQDADSIEAWFDQMMSQVGGWYTRSMQSMSWMIALVLAFALNADMVTVAQEMYRQPALRAAVTDTAVKYVQDKPADDPDAEKRLLAVKEQLNKLQIPLGWKVQAVDMAGVLREVMAQLDVMKVLRLLLSSALFTLGAPFWFDLLSKLVNLRSYGQTQKEKEAAP